MLVLSRRKDEVIMIGDDIAVYVTDVRGDKVRIGIEAPKEVKVHRREIYAAIARKEEQKAATATIASWPSCTSPATPVIACSRKHSRSRLPMWKRKSMAT